MNRRISLIGAPTDIGAGARGASMGPEALRVAQLGPTLEGHGLEVVDRGNLVGPANPWRPPVDGYRHLDEVVAWNHAVHHAVLAELREERLPILLGGDHCLAIGSISAVARHCRERGRKLRVLWLDAHADFNTSVLTPSGNLHGMPVACLCGHGPRALVELGAADGHAGPAISPKVVRQIGIRSVDPGEKRFVHEQGLEVQDRGNLAGPANPWLPPVDGYRHLGEVVAWNQAVHDAVHAELALGRLPILLGGDHCLAVGSISAVARHCRDTGRKLRVLWLDAHADFNTNRLTPSGNLHGMPVACLCGHGPQALVEIGGAVPAIQPKWIRQIGIRSVDPGEKRFVHEVGLEVFDMRYIDEMGMRHAMELALATLDERTHLHVSFDVDFLDPEIAPGVGTTVPGGPTYREAQLCMEMIADTGRLASLDVMELNPALDLRNRTAALAVDLIESLFGKSTLMRT